MKDPLPSLFTWMVEGPTIPLPTDMVKPIKQTGIRPLQGIHILSAGQENIDCVAIIAYQLLLQCLEGRMRCDGAKECAC